MIHGDEKSNFPIARGMPFIRDERWCHFVAITAGALSSNAPSSKPKNHQFVGAGGTTSTPCAPFPTRIFLMLLWLFASITNTSFESLFVT